jgi:hypothetical protein
VGCARAVNNLSCLSLLKKRISRKPNLKLTKPSLISLLSAFKIFFIHKSYGKWRHLSLDCAHTDRLLLSFPTPSSPTLSLSAVSPLHQSHSARHLIQMHCCVSHIILSSPLSRPKMTATVFDSPCQTSPKQIVKANHSNTNCLRSKVKK